MDSPQSVVSPPKSSAVVQSPNILVSKENDIHAIGEFMGALDVHIHHARDIHNICIYQKQDVYAKLCLTSDPEKTVATKINIGGGRNPVFDEKLRLNVARIDSSLKCEIWMLSRVQNYMEDQLLGFSLVPVSEILLHDGKLEKEFSLSSTDLFHSPAGFVELSVSYVGAPPDVIPISTPPPPTTTTCVDETINGEMDKIEFPDPKVANENHQMVEEYFEICTKRGESQKCCNGTDDQHQHEEKTDSPLTTESSITWDSKLPVDEEQSPPLPKDKEKSAGGSDAESNESGGDAFVKPLVGVKFEAEPQVVQQDIVDMYMKSMQQFTESLAKMKLPMDYENGPSSSENSTTTDQKTPLSKNSGTRVFYGSRAFF